MDDRAQNVKAEPSSNGNGRPCAESSRSRAGVEIIRVEVRRAEPSAGEVMQRILAGFGVYALCKLLID